jgi:hypothetical protein
LNQQNPGQTSSPGNLNETKPTNTAQQQAATVVNTQPQETGPIPLLAKYTKNGFSSGDMSLSITINPEVVGPWEIISEFTEWTWQALTDVYVNNQKKQVVLESRVDSRDLEKYVSTDKQSFYISSTNIASLVKDDIVVTGTENEIKDWNSISVIKSNIQLVATSKEKYTKYNQTKNTKDVIPDSYQNFNFTVTLKL